MHSTPTAMCDLDQGVVANRVDRVAVVPQLDQHAVAPEGTHQLFELMSRCRRTIVEQCRGDCSLAGAGECPHHPAGGIGHVGQRELGCALLPRQVAEADRSRHASVAGGAVGQQHEPVPGRIRGELALERAAIDVERHGLEKVAFRHRGDSARHFGRRPQEVIDQRIDRAFHFAPCAGAKPQLDALLGLALAADHLADALELPRHLLVGPDDVVEGVGNLAFQPGSAPVHPDRKVAGAHGLEGLKESPHNEVAVLVLCSAVFGLVGEDRRDSRI